MMVSDINQINTLSLWKLSLPHFVGLMEFTDKEVNHFFSQPGMTWPANVRKRYDVFHAAYQRLDAAYCCEPYSLLTDKIKEVNLAGWRVFLGIKKLIKGRMQTETDQDLRDQALLLLHSIDRYGIKKKDDYLKLNSRFRQWLQELEETPELEAALVALDIERPAALLQKYVMEVRNLITRRGTNAPIKGEMLAARKAICPEYKALLSFINAAALSAEDETRFDPLIKTLNGNIKYLNAMVIARKGAAASGEKEAPTTEAEEALPAEPM